MEAKTTDRISRVAAAHARGAGATADLANPPSALHPAGSSYDMHPGLGSAHGRLLTALCCHPASAGLHCTVPVRSCAASSTLQTQLRRQLPLGSTLASPGARAAGHMKL